MSRALVILIATLLATPTLAARTADEPSGSPGGEGPLELGITLGLPGGLNGVVGYGRGPVSVRLSGMAWGTVAGAQVDLAYRFAEDGPVRHSVGPVIGTTELSDDYWDYLGLAYTLQYRSFMFQTGLSVGSGTYSSPQVLLQLGYLHRFLGG